MHKDGLHASVVISGHRSLCDTCLPYQHSLDNFSRRHMCNQMGNANQQSHRTSYQWHLPVTTKHTRDTMKRSGRKTGARGLADSPNQMKQNGGTSAPDCACKSVQYNRVSHRV